MLGYWLTIVQVFWTFHTFFLYYCTGWFLFALHRLRPTLINLFRCIWLQHWSHFQNCHGGSWRPGTGPSKRLHICLHCLDLLYNYGVVLQGRSYVPLHAIDVCIFPIDRWIPLTRVRMGLWQHRIAAAVSVFCVSTFLASFFFHIFIFHPVNHSWQIKSYAGSEYTNGHDSPVPH